MSITPIEIVSMAPKSQQVSQYKQQDSQRPLNEQFHMNSQFNHEVKHNSQQPMKASKSDEQETKYDPREKGNNGYSQSNQRKKRKSKEKQQNLLRPGSIDIKI